MNPLLEEREVEFYVEDSGARYLFGWHELAPGVAEVARAAGASVVAVAPGEFDSRLAAFDGEAGTVNRASDDTAIILYTSGTTGRPKGAELTHANLSRNAHVAAVTLLGLQPADLVLGCRPLFHAFGQIGLPHESLGEEVGAAVVPAWGRGRRPSGSERSSRNGSPPIRAPVKCG